MTLTDEQKSKITSALWHYHLDQYHRISNYDNIIDNREEVTPGVFYYPCPLQDVYLDADCYAVDYDRQHVFFYYYDENGEIILDENDMPAEDLPEGSYTSRKGYVYYDSREEIPTIDPDATGDTSIINVLTYLGDYEWKRNTPGGGGVH